MMRGRGKILAAIGLTVVLLPLSVSAALARPWCRDFATYQDAVAYCLATYGTTVACGGLDRDQDGRPCECNPGGPEADDQACISRRKASK